MVFQFPQRGQQAAACTLPGHCDFPKGCESCGWNKNEAERRERLPLWKNNKGLWQRRIGRSSGAGWRA